MARWRSSSCIPAALSGRRRTSARGPFPRANTARAKTPLKAARREFTEETGFDRADGDFIDLGTIRQAGGKLVSVWAVEGDCDPAQLHSNTCMIEWPPRSGRQLEIPEVDRGAWFGIDEARERILKSQAPVIELLIARLGQAN